MAQIKNNTQGKYITAIGCLVIALILVLTPAAGFLGSTERQIYAATARDFVTISNIQGTVICSDGTTFSNVLLTVDADAIGNKISGIWILSNVHEDGSTSLLKRGDITGGTVQSKKTFTLTGTETSDLGCGSTPPITVTFAGNCGTNQQVRFESSSGQIGNFVGKVTCGLVKQ